LAARLWRLEVDRVPSQDDNTGMIPVHRRSVLCGIRRSASTERPAFGERGNLGISILTQLLVALLAGFLIWGLLPPTWKAYLRSGPWGWVVMALIGLVLVVATTRAVLERREHRRAHRRVSKVLNETLDPALQKKAALWLIEHERNHPERLDATRARLFEILLRVMASDPEKLDRARAANGLGLLRDRRAIEPLLQATKDEYAYVRAEAVFALGRLRAGQAKTRIRELLQDDWDAGVRGRAKEALERIDT
jgi:HEAT repeat protein